MDYDLVGQIIEFGQGDFVTSILATVKTILIITSLILLPFFAFVIYKLRSVFTEEVKEIVEDIDFTPPKEGNSPYEARWAEIKKHVYSASTAEWKFAIVEADKLMDDALKAAGFAGESMGERMMSIQPGQIANLDALWRAHKVRNQVVHDVGFDLKHGQAVDAIEIYEGVLRELGGID